jgi:hypothetical protein
MTRPIAATCSMPCLTGRARTSHCSRRPHARSTCPRAHVVSCPRAAIKPTLMHDHPPSHPLRIAPSFPEPARSSGNLPVTRLLLRRPATVASHSCRTPTSPETLDNFPERLRCLSKLEPRPCPARTVRSASPDFGRPPSHVDSISR